MIKRGYVADSLPSAGCMVWLNTVPTWMAFIVEWGERKKCRKQVEFVDKCSEKNSENAMKKEIQ